MNLKIGTILLVTALSLSAKAQSQEHEAETPFLESYPHLEEMLYRSPDPGYRMGAGLSPVGFLKDKLMLSLNLFEVHRIRPHYEWTLLKVTWGLTMGRPSKAQSNQLLLRSAWRWRMTESWSLGPMVGYEFISFSEVKSRATKDSYATPVEPFSAKGLIYGVSVSKSFALGEQYQLKLNATGYQQTYSIEKNSSDWAYVFLDEEVAGNTALIEPGSAFLLELSFLY